MLWAAALLLMVGSACSSGSEEPTPNPDGGTNTPTPPVEQTGEVEAYVTSQNLSYTFTPIEDHSRPHGSVS